MAKNIFKYRLIQHEELFDLILDLHFIESLLDSIGKKNLASKILYKKLREVLNSSIDDLELAIYQFTPIHRGLEFKAEWNEKRTELFALIKLKDSVIPDYLGEEFDELD